MEQLSSLQIISKTTLSKFYIEDISSYCTSVLKVVAVIRINRRVIRSLFSFFPVSSPFCFSFQCGIKTLDNFLQSQQIV